jgi:hypothetical protein
MAPSEPDLVPPRVERIFLRGPLLPPLPQWFSGASIARYRCRDAYCPLYFYYRYSSCSWAGADVEFQRVDSIHGEFVVPENRVSDVVVVAVVPAIAPRSRVEITPPALLLKFLFSMADGTMDPRLRPTILPRTHTAFDLTASDATLAYSFLQLCQLVVRGNLSALAQRPATSLRCDSDPLFVRRGQVSATNHGQASPKPSISVHETSIIVVIEQTAMLSTKKDRRTI